MINLIKPKALKKGDKIATVSLSWGGAGDRDILWRYEQGNERLEKEFEFEVVEMQNTLKGSNYIYNNSQKRAEDLMNAFKDKSIKGIFLKVGLSTFYGPSILAEFAENVEMFNYTKHWFEKAIFNTNGTGEINHFENWTSEYLSWDITNKNIQRNTYKNEGYEVLQGNGIVIGKPYENNILWMYRRN